MKINTKKMATIGMLTALYVVLSAFLKFTLVGNIMIDLGYIAYAFALCMFGSAGIIVGVLGCALESILFSAYGLSISWCLANLAIGLICFNVLKKDVNNIAKFLIVLIGVAVGMLGVKTLVECYLYNIPLVVKLPKNAVAFAADAVTMIAGVFFYSTTKKKLPKI